jgi:hypothetical protein
MPTIYRGVHLSVQHHSASAYMRVVRSEVAIDSVADAIKGFDACQAALASVAVRESGILFDWRRSPMSTDPNLHKLLVARIDDLAKPFARRAILLATTVGTMQASRVGRALGNQVLTVFDDETAAVEFVTSR